MDIVSNRIPPHNSEAEQSVLGSVMISENAVATALELLDPNDFYSAAHREIFSAIMELFQKGRPVDLVTVLERLDSRGTTEGVGGAAYVAELSRQVPSTANVRYYADIVREKSMLRRLIEAGNSMANDGFEDSKTAEAALSDAESVIFNIAMRKNSDTLRHIDDALIDGYEQIMVAVENKGRPLGVLSGFPELDRKTAGFQAAQLIVVAGRPGMGKTSFALNMAQHAAVHDGVPVALFSLEMAREQLAVRLMCAEAMVDMQKARLGDLRNEDFKKLSEAMKPLSTAPIFIDDTAGISVAEIRSKCRRLKMHRGLGLIVIDYLQLMQSHGKSENRQLEISEMTRALKNTSRELEVPIIVLSQLSRAPEARKGNRPMLSDLRESGAIEQDADLVMFLYRESYYNEDTDDNTAEVIIAKQRSGPTGTVELAWLEQYTKFASLEKHRME